MPKHTIWLTAKDKTKQAFDSVRDNINGLAKSSLAIGTVSAAGFAALAVKSAESANELRRMVTVSGEGAESFQKLSYAAGLYGIEQDKVADILKDTNDKIGDFMQTGGGPLKDFFENIAPKVGITAEKFKNLSSKEALGLYVDSLEKANVSQQDMTFYMEAIASDSTMLVPLLKDGSKALNEQAEEAEKLGLVLSEMDISKLTLADQQYKKSSKVLTAFVNHMSVAVSPVIEGVANEFLNVAKESGGMGEVANKVVAVLVKVLGHAANAVQGLKLAWVAVKHAAVVTISKVVEVVAAGDRALTSFVNKFTPWTKEINHDLTLMSGNLMLMAQETGQALQDEVNKPLSSAQIEVWYAEVVRKSEKAAEKIRETISDPLGSMGNDGDSKTVSKLQEFINKNRTTAKDFTAIWQGAFDNFTKGAGDSLADVILDQKKAGDALRETMRSVLRSVISALGQIGAKKATLWALDKAGIATTTAANVTAGFTTAAAWAPAAAAVSLSTFGANAVPASAGMASTYALSKALSLTGVAHDGLSEVPTDGTYLLQKKEKVVSNKDSAKLDRLLDGGGGDTYNVYVNLNALDTRSSQDWLYANSDAVLKIVQKSFNARAQRGPLG